MAPQGESPSAVKALLVFAALYVVIVVTLAWWIVSSALEVGIYGNS